MVCCNCSKPFIKHKCVTKKDAHIRVGDITCCSGCFTIQVVDGHTLMTLYTRKANKEEEREFFKAMGMI